MKRLVILNAFPLNAFEYPVFTCTIEQVNVDKVKEISKYFNEIKCYIRHPSTVQVLNETFELNLEPSSDIYRYQMGDELLVVTLRKPVRGREVNVTIDDLVFYHVVVKPSVEL